MKKIFLMISIVLISISIKAQEYLTLQFSSASDVPQISYNNAIGNYKITSNTDLDFTILLSKYVITNCTKKYPKAHLLQHPKAEGLDRIYNIQITGNVNELYNELIKIKSKIISTYYISDLPKPLLTPNDYSYNFAFCNGIANSGAYLNLINAQQAWDITQGNPDIVIAIADIGFDKTHEDLVNKVLPSPVYFSDYTSDINWGYHGTLVAGLAACETNNNKGLASIGNKCPVKFFDYFANNNSPFDNILTDLTPKKSRVINCSYYTGCSFRQDEQNIIDIAFDSGIVVVAAAGNGLQGGHCGGTTDPNNYVYPASYNHVISVAQIGSMFDRDTYFSCFPLNDQIGFSWKDIHETYPTLQPSTYHSPPLSTYTGTHNDKVDLCAPWAARVLSPNNGYGNAYGSSISSPIVSGTVALILSVNPTLNADDVEAILKCTARDVYEIPENLPYLNLLGSGRVDAGKAVQLAQTWVHGSAPLQQAAPSDIRWFEILSNGVNTIEVESACAANTNPGYCNIGYRLQVVAANSSQTFKWLAFYSENNINISNNIKYGNSIYLTRGVDYPFVNNSLGNLKVCVRVNECIPSIYYAEARTSACLGVGCTYNCPADITITGNYAIPLTESYTWVKSAGATNIATSISVKLDASPLQGYIEFKPTSAADYLLAQPTATGQFIVQAYNGCDAGTPSIVRKTITEELEEEQKGIDKISVYPNPTNGLFYVECNKSISSLQVYNNLGILILEKQMNTIKKGSQKSVIDLSNFPAGVYILRSKGEAFNYKIIKL